jgi:hypothetical protein
MNEIDKFKSEVSKGILDLGSDLELKTRSN